MLLIFDQGRELVKVMNENAAPDQGKIQFYFLYLLLFFQSFYIWVIPFFAKYPEKQISKDLISSNFIRNLSIFPIFGFAVAFSYLELEQCRQIGLLCYSLFYLILMIIVYKVANHYILRSQNNAYWKASIFFIFMAILLLLRFHNNNNSSVVLSASLLLFSLGIIMLWKFLESLWIWDRKVQTEFLNSLTQVLDRLNNSKDRDKPTLAKIMDMILFILYMISGIALIGLILRLWISDHFLDKETVIVFVLIMVTYVFLINFWSYLYKRVSYKWRVLILMALGLFLVSYALNPSRGHYVDLVKADAGSLFPLDTLNARIYSDTLYLKKNEVVYLVCAQGGGSRAAIWTGSILGTLDSLSKNQFYGKLLGISTVSGSSQIVNAYIKSKMIDRDRNTLDIKRFVKHNFLTSGIFYLFTKDAIPPFLRSLVGGRNLKLELDEREAFTHSLDTVVTKDSLMMSKLMEIEKSSMIEVYKSNPDHPVFFCQHL